MVGRILRERERMQNEKGVLFWRVQTVGTAHGPTRSGNETTNLVADLLRGGKLLKRRNTIPRLPRESAVSYKKVTCLLPIRWGAHNPPEAPVINPKRTSPISACRTSQRHINRLGAKPGRLRA